MVSLLLVRKRGLLTTDEEDSLVRYIKNCGHCLQGMSATQVEDVVLHILRTREKINKKGGWKFKVLSLAANMALQKKKVSHSSSDCELPILI